MASAPKELDKWTAAQRQAWFFLLGIGRHVEENGKKIWKEALPDTDEEKKEIENLISVLKDDPPKQIIITIARLLKGDENKDTWHKRTLKFGFAGKGRRKKHIEHYAIIRSIQFFIESDMSVEAAIFEASELFDKTPEALWKIWKKTVPQQE